MKLAERVYQTNEVITFSKTSGAYYGLSNRAPEHSLFVNEVNIQSSEILFHTIHFSLFPAIQERLVKTENPMVTDKLSLDYGSYARQDWEKVQFKVMRWCLEVKLIQNFDKFSSLLLKTGEKPMVEYSSKDKIWGASPFSLVY